MSTVIWYKGVLYSDSQLSNGKTVDEKGVKIPKEIKTGEKLFRVNNRIYGVTGTLNGYHDFVKRRYKGSWRWSLNSSNFALIVQWDGKNLISWKLIEKKIWKFYFSWFEKTEYIWKSNPGLILYMGSGDDFAIEANEMGLNEKEMIQYASDRDPFTDDNVVSMSL